MQESAPQLNFLAFPFSRVLQEAISKAGYKVPTDVQFDAIPAILEGRDVFARAKTGTGKTAAFVLPLLENLSKHNIYRQHKENNSFDGFERARSNQIQVLVLVPTRELAMQVYEVFARFAVDIKPRLKCLSVYGGARINQQMMALRSGVDILVATPGRMLDLVAQKSIKFNQIKVLVIDEADRLMRGDFRDSINRIIKLLPNQRQNLMFTATFPDSIRELVREVLRRPLIINVDQALKKEIINHRVFTVNRNKKDSLLAHLLNTKDWRQVLIFCSAKRTCDNLLIKLEKHGIKAVVLHGNKRQSERAMALSNFKFGVMRILVATDVAGRGLDIKQLPCVINYDLPRSPNDYIHRVGRTGRAGQIGQAISLIYHDEYKHFSVIEKRNGLLLPREQIKGFEADKIAPPKSERTHPKKQSKTKNKSKSAKVKSSPEHANKKAEYSSTNPTLEQHNITTKQPAVNAHIWRKLS